MPNFSHIYTVHFCFVVRKGGRESISSIVGFVQFRGEKRSIKVDNKKQNNIRPKRGKGDLI